MPRPNFSQHAPPPQTPVYSDASSSCWPPGWNYDRYRHATHADIAELPEGELLKMQVGLRDVLGEDGVERLAMHVYEEQQRQSGADAKESVPGYFPPNWLKHWSERHKGQTWGVVAFRTASYDDSHRWEAFTKEVDRIIEIPFQRAVDEGNVPDESTGSIKEARSQFEIRWIEDAALASESADDLRARFDGLKPDLPAGMSDKVFLVASNEAIASVLDLEEAERPTTKSMWWRPSAPFLVAVAVDPDPGLEEGHEEREWFRPIFKVAAEVVVEELLWLLDSDIMPLRRITRSVKGLENITGNEVVGDRESDDLWWSTAPSPQRMRKRRGV
ncbi:hypothetical protein COL154_002640 [Colletotrichum chrysophilum]|uniref:Uncharacterized protein n=1 Tax=Colletotrichum chrysophilum TaxID=1836956 RepID=A0AAD9AJP4_9PEZI|nr:uncharacterized protein COL26b_002088 [Colletotrichum chrysophilum]KAJ0346171.1 hypothetical protein KNSL1_007745 [Colletotrichum chrysophilum]KAJ0368359.1 hypothetical protein COL154_002640 [Colletotrichum chrysophilum]KAJ0379580.1 hypothetical protein COL26b_002088 [Colletotrichum chrysophilum]KAK1849311.1 hypothetical protein CCHR01_08066 [Colletotrichum chrysophilum]